MRSGSFHLPWPAALVALSLFGAVSLRFSTAADGAYTLASALALALLAILVQARTREWGGGRWAGDAAACALVLGSPLLLEAAAGSPLPVAALLLFFGFSISRPGGGRAAPPRILAAALLCGVAMVLVPPSLPVAAAVLAWAVASPDSAGRRLFGGSLRQAALRSLACIPAGLAAVHLLMQAAILPPGPLPVVGLAGLIWARPCCCGTKEAAVLFTSRAGSLAAVPWLLLVLPGVFIAMRRFERRWDGLLCLMVMASPAVIALIASGRGLDSPLLGGLLGPAHSGLAARGAELWEAVTTGLILVLPFSLLFVSLSLDRMRNLPAMMGPRLAGLGGGLVAGALIWGALSLFRSQWVGEELLTRGPPLVAAVMGGLVIGGLLPGSASGRGRLLSLLSAAATATIIVVLLVLLEGSAA